MTELNVLVAFLTAVLCLLFSFVLGNLFYVCLIKRGLPKMAFIFLIGQMLLTFAIFNAISTLLLYSTQKDIRAIESFVLKIIGQPLHIDGGSLATCLYLALALASTFLMFAIGFMQKPGSNQVI